MPLRAVFENTKNPPLSIQQEERVSVCYSVFRLSCRFLLCSAKPIPVILRTTCRQACCFPDFNTQRLCKASQCFDGYILMLQYKMRYNQSQHEKCLIYSPLYSEVIPSWVTSTISAVAGLPGPKTRPQRCGLACVGQMTKANTIIAHSVTALKPSLSADAVSAFSVHALAGF